MTEEQIQYMIDNYPNKTKQEIANDISNLRVMTREEHARLHMELRAQDTRDSLD